MMPGEVTQATNLDEMAENEVKSHLYVLIFKGLYIAQSLCTLGLLFVRLRLRLLCTRLAIYSFPNRFLGDLLINKPSSRATETNAVAV